MNVMVRDLLIRWIPLAFVICACCGLIYAAVQQDYRQSANDPQIQIAEDGASALAFGMRDTSIVPAGSIDISSSLDPYIVIYDASGQPVAGDGLLDNALPKLPAGVFPAVQAEGGESRFTWQPRPGVRSAVVVTAVKGGAGGFVMAGRSLREVENRESELTLQVGLVLLFALVGSFFLTAFGLWVSGKPSAR